MIYFIRQRTLFKTLVKIGFTDQTVSKRLSSIKTENPNKLDVLMVLPGDRTTEDVYHNMFEKYQVHREWFRYGFWLRVFILKNRHNIIKYETLNDTLKSIEKSESKGVTGKIKRYDNKLPQVFYNEVAHFEETGELPGWIYSDDSFTDRIDQ